MLVSSAVKNVDLLWRKDLFNLTTNDFGKAACSIEELLADYKGQYPLVRGFRLLKDPAFLAPSPFLKNEQQIPDC